jgi:hypothetical protein
MNTKLMENMRKKMGRAILLKKKYSNLLNQLKD